jgi:YVTN family beta-propeller protein
MQFRLLGAMDVVDEGQPVAIGGPKQRLLLAVLLMRRPEAVSSAALADALWGECAPPTAAKTVQVFVARLRKALGEGVVLTERGGYAVHVPPEAVDADRFEQLLEAGRDARKSGRPEEAARLLQAALDLWRGPALGDLNAEPPLQQFVLGLESLRVDALEERIEADLDSGRHARVVPELEALIAAEPLRERPYGLLMQALYRAGRQAEALAVFHTARRTLLEEVGVEPGPALRRLQDRILAQDPELAPPEGSRIAAPRRTASRHRLKLALAAAVAAAVMGAAALVVADEPSTPPAVRADSVVVIDPGSAAVIDTIGVGSAPVGIAAGEGAIWVASAGEQTLERIDPRTRRVSGRVGLGRVPSAVAVGEGAVWVASAVGERGTVARIEPGAVAMVDAVSVRDGVGDDDFAPHTPSSLVAAHGSLWANRGRGEIARVPADGATRSSVRLGPSHSADGLAAGEGAIWLTSSADDRLLRIEPRSGRISASIAIASRRGVRLAGPYGVATGFGSVWVANALADTVSRVDPRLGAVTATVRVGRRPTRVAVGEGAIWVLDAGDGTVMRVDPRTNTVTARLSVPGATGIAARAGAVWVSVAGGRAKGRAAAHREPTQPLRSATCGSMLTGAGAPDVLIASDLPTWLGPRPAPVIRDMRLAIRLVLEDHGYRAGRHSVGYQACDDSRRREGFSSADRCASNARTYAGNPRLVGVIGPYHSSCATIALPLLNAAPGGPIAMVSPTNTYEGLTRAGPATAADEPDRFYPTSFRSYARTVRSDDGQAAALVTFARRRGVRRLFVLDDSQATGYGVGRYLAAAAPALGVRVVGAGSWPAEPAGLPRLVDRVTAARPDGVVLAGCFCAGGFEVLAALRRALPESTVYLGSDAMLAPRAMFPRPHPAADGLYVSVAGTAVEAANAAGRRLLARLARERPLAALDPAVLQAAIATEVLLDAIGRSDGSRAGVVNALRETRLSAGVGAGLAFDDAGDPRRGEFSIYRIDRDTTTPREREVAGMVFEASVRPTTAIP